MAFVPLFGIRPFSKSAVDLTETKKVGYVQVESIPPKTIEDASRAKEGSIFKFFDRKKDPRNREIGATVTLKDVRLRMDSEQDGKLGKRFSTPDCVMAQKKFSTQASAAAEDVKFEELCPKIFAGRPEETAKSDLYKNPEYFNYHSYSYYDAMMCLKGKRNETPTQSKSSTRKLLANM